MITSPQLVANDFGPRFLPGAFAEVQFRSSLDVRRRHWRLRVRIVRVFEGGCGVAFTDNATLAVDCLQELAAAQCGDKRLVPVKPDKNTLAHATEERELLKAAEASVANLATKHLGNFFTELIDRTETRVGHATPEGLGDRIQATPAVDWEHLRKVCVAQLNERVNRAVRGTFRTGVEGTSNTGDAEPQNELRLVEDGEFDVWCTMGELSITLASGLTQVLEQMEGQFKAIGLRVGRRIENPVTPIEIIRSIQGVLEANRIPSDTQRLCFEVAGEMLAVVLPRFYQAIVEVLTENGFAPEPEQRPAAVVPSNKPRPFRDTGSATGQSSEQVDAAQSDREPPIGREEVHRILRLLTLIQQQPSDGAVVADLQLQQLAESQFIGADGSPGLRPRQAHQAIENLTFIDQVVSSGDDDQFTPDQIRIWLQKLKVPLAKSVLLDPTFFVNDRHPARRVLDALSDIGRQLAVGGGGHTVKIRVDQLLDRVVQEFDDDPSVFAGAADDLERIRDQQGRVFQNNVDRAVDAKRGRERLRLAREAVSATLVVHLKGRRLPPAFVELLQSGWRNVLELTYLRNGPESREWAEALQVLQQLLYLLAGRLDEDLVAVHALTEDIQEKLSSVNPDAFAVSALVENVRRAVGDASSQGDPAAWATIDEVFPAKVGAQGDELAPPDGADTERWRQAMADAAAVAVGDVLEQITDDEDLKSGLVAWIDEADHSLLLVDGNGEREHALSLGRLTQALYEKKVAIHQHQHSSLFQQATRALIAKMEEQLTQQFRADPLTGLGTRRTLAEEVNHRLEAARADPERRFALCLVDLDRFRVVNATAGTDSGDELLRKVAVTLSQNVGQDGHLARVGADVFGVLLDHVTPARVRDIAETICRSISEIRHYCNDASYPVTASLGVVMLPGAFITEAQAYDAAETACKGAKQAGMNQVLVFNKSDTEIERQLSGMQWVVQVNEALEYDRLFLRCHRIAPIELSSGLKSHYEVLLGVRGRDGEPLPLDAFVSAAEGFGRMDAVDRVVVDKVCRWMRDNPAKLARLDGLSVNLSGRSVGSEQCATYIRESFAKYGVDPSKICFEVTETAALASLEKATRFIEAVRALGCQFALDDFGSGMASYSYLQSLDVDYVKIDGIFVKHLVTNPSDFAVVRSINEISHFMGKKTVAEYVENEAIWNKLKEIHVDFGQGFGIERPKPIDEL